MPDLELGDFHRIQRAVAAGEPLSNADARLVLTAMVDASWTIHELMAAYVEEKYDVPAHSRKYAPAQHKADVLRTLWAQFANRWYLAPHDLEYPKLRDSRVAPDEVKVVARFNRTWPALLPPPNRTQEAVSHE